MLIRKIYGPEEGRGADGHFLTQNWTKPCLACPLQTATNTKERERRTRAISNQKAEMGTQTPASLDKRELSPARPPLRPDRAEDLDVSTLPEKKSVCIITHHS